MQPAGQMGYGRTMDPLAAYIGEPDSEPAGYRGGRCCEGLGEPVTLSRFSATSTAGTTARNGR
jgi:hypothetical protein